MTGGQLHETCGRRSVGLHAAPTRRHSPRVAADSIRAAIAGSAGGYAACTLFPEGTEALPVEYTIKPAGTNPLALHGSRPADPYSP